MAASAVFALGIALATPSWAQTSPDDTDGEVVETTGDVVANPNQNAAVPDESLDSAAAEGIVVVGSRIARVNVDTPNPVQIFDDESIAATGAATLEDFLLESNIAGPGIVNEAATLAQVAGSSFFDSRGFGTGYTLVLLNGRRLPGTPTTGEAATDLNQIPLAAVERVEFLSQGASALYGSDAISGVINIVTKRRFNGLSLLGRYGISDKGDGNQYRLSMVAGASSDRGSAVLTAEYYAQKAVRATARPLIRSALNEDIPNDGRSPAGFPGTIIDTSFTTAVPYVSCPESSVRESTVSSNGEECAFDIAPLYQVFPTNERFSASGFAEYDVTDNLNVWGDIRYARVFTEVRNGAAPALFLVPTTAIPADQLPAEFADEEEVYIYRRIVDGGPRARDQTNQTFGVAAGADYEWAPGHKLEGYFQHTWVDNNSIGVGGQVSTSRLQDAVADGTFDLFNLNGQDVIDAITVRTFRVAQLEETVWNAVASGRIPFFGDTSLGYAIGAEARNESYADEVDPITEDNDIAGGAGSTGAGFRNSKAAFAELVFSPFDMLELQGALRYDDIRGVAGKLGDQLTYQLAGKFQPIEQILVRANYGTGFKAPSLGELYLGTSFGVQSAIDVRACEEAGDPEDPNCDEREIRSQGGGNPNLKPEESVSWGVGVVANPLPSLRLSADYWNIKVDGKIGALGIQEILNNEDQYPELVNRIGGRLVDPDSFVRTNLQNLVTEQGRGIDFVANFNTDVYNDVGLVAELRASHLLAFERQTSAIQPLCDEAGTTSEPKWRGNARLGLNGGAWNTNVSARYTGKTVDNPGGRVSGSCDFASPEDRFQVDDYLQIDWNIGFKVEETYRFTLGVRNVFDKAPPVSVSAAGGWPFYDQNLYDNMGRFIYVEAGIDF